MLPGSTPHGNGWLIGQVKRLGFPHYTSGQPTLLVVIDGATTSQWFVTTTADSYMNLYNFDDRIYWDEDAHEFSFIDPEGTQWIFGDHTMGDDMGMLIRVIDAYGRNYNIDYDAGLIQSFVQTTEGGTVRYDYVWETLLSGDRITSVTHQVDGVNVRRSVYSYHSGDDGNGNAGDLQSAHVEHFNEGTGAWQRIRSMHYRYYMGTEADEPKCLKYVVQPAAYERMLAAGLAPETVPEATLVEYADFRFSYEAKPQPDLVTYQFWVSEEKLRGGQETYSFSYIINETVGGENDMAVRTVETRPDGSKMVVYCNGRNQVIARALYEAEIEGEPEWCEATHYESYFPVFHLHHSAISSFYAGEYTVTYTPRAHEGLVDTFYYYGETAPECGQLWLQGVRKGWEGNIALTHRYAYTERTVGVASIFPLATAYQYRSMPIALEDWPPSSGQLATLNAVAIITTAEYLFYEDRFRVEQETKTLPPVPHSENGITGAAFVETTIYDLDGRPVWQRNSRGAITYQLYHPATGAPLQRIDDVNTALMENVPTGWATAFGFGLHLITDYESDALGRVTLELRPPESVQLQLTDTEPTNIRRARFTIFNDGEHERRSGQGYAILTWAGAPTSYATVGGITLLKLDSAGNVIDTIVSARTNTSGWLTATESFPRHLWSRWGHQVRDIWGRLMGTRRYFEIPASGDGSQAANYLEERIGYDNRAREIRLVDAPGTITRRVYNIRGLVTEIWIGTDDTGATFNDPDGDGALPNNMRKAQGMDYDADGNVTELRVLVDGTGNDRITENTWDFRSRLAQTEINDGVRLLITVPEYDNMNRVTQVTGYHTGVSAGQRIRRWRNYYDSWSRVYKVETDGVDPADGSITETLATENWYDGASNVIKSSQAGNTAFAKTVYNGMNWPTVSYAVCVPGTAGVPRDNSNAVDDDTVMEQSETTYNRYGESTLSVLRRRLDTAALPPTAGAKGPLQGPSATERAARVTWLAMFRDALGRPRVSADYGTNGGSVLELPAIAPERSDTILVTTTHYKDSGDANKIIDPMGIETRWENDKLGRRVRLIEGADEARVTEFAWHASGQMQTLTLINPTTGNQVTRWAFGTTTEDSGIARNDLLRTKVYPESDDRPAPAEDGPDGVYARLEYTYNRAGEVVTFKDADGTVHAYEYDKLGRQTEDKVTTLATGLDDAVLRIQRQYEVRGMVSKITSHSLTTGGEVVNEVELTYSPFGLLVDDYQEHDGAVHGGTPKVTYDYTSGSGNQLRRTKTTYPSAAEVNAGYGATNSVDDHFNRIAAMDVEGEANDLVQYRYAGVNWPIGVKFPGDVNLFLNTKRVDGEPVGDAGDIYVGFDRFGRACDIRWQTSAFVDVERIQYGFDRDSRRTWRRRTMTQLWDHAYNYDTLSQVTAEDRGDINSNHTAIAGVPEAGSRWDYDKTGNWAAYQTLADGAATLNQTRVHDKGNRLTQVSAAALMQTDRSGRMTQVPQSSDWSDAVQIKWDAWSRIVEVREGETILAAYAYDGLTRRITTTIDSAPRETYYNDAWKPVEDGGYLYYWGARHRDDLIRRDDDESNSHTVLMDYFSPAALTDNNGDVVERYDFSAFGQRTLLAANFDPIVISSVDFTFAFQGQFEDTETGWLNYGYRYYLPNLGRFACKDPIEEGGGNNLFSAADNDLLNKLDYLGLIKYQQGWCWEINRKCINGVDTCQYECACPPGYIMGSVSRFTTQPCSYDTPTRTCFRPDLWDAVVIVGLLALTQLDSPVPGPADALAVGLAGARYGRLLAL